MMAELSSVMKLSTAVVPSASYSAPGSVITSMRLMVEAGMARKMSLELRVSDGAGRPFLYILKSVEPFTRMVPSASTDTMGTLRSTSLTMRVGRSGSAVRSKATPSILRMTIGFWAVTVMASSVSADSLITKVPKSTTGASSDMVKVVSTSFIPTYDRFMR